MINMALPTREEKMFLLIFLCLTIDVSTTARIIANMDKVPMKSQTEGLTFGPFDDNSDPSLQGYEIPNLKMMKRQIRNFKAKQTASVTLVFHTSTPVQIRWYVLDRRNIAASSEIPNMIPAEADPSLIVSHMSSGDVTATSLVIPKFTKTPVEYECVISTLEGTSQYQIKTTVRKETVFQLDSVDSPEWMLVPKPFWNFTLNIPLQVKCKAFVPFQKAGSTNELNLYKATPITDNKQLKKFELNSIISVHSHTPDFAEEEGTTILQGMRMDMKKGHAFYEVRMSTPNTTKNFAGIYLCKIERELHQDKMYFMSSAVVTGEVSPFPFRLRVHLIHCKTGMYNPASATLVLTEGEPTCIRCRGFGYPRPKVAVYRGESIVLPDPDEGVYVNTFTNVADGGIQESMVIFRNPTHKLTGRYSCRAENGPETKPNTEKLLFRLTVRKHSPYL